MQLVRLLITGSILFLLTGCFQIATVVRINPDGSGTVEESMLLSKKIFAEINQLMQGFAGASGEKPKSLELFEPAKLREQARAMGEGVAYRSGKKVETAEYTGFTATYTFTDINNLKLSRNSGELTGTTKPASLPLTFHFSKGSPATLTIVQARTEAAGKAPVAPAAEPAAPSNAPSKMSEADARKFVEMFMGMKFVLAVEVNGTIVSTNATHRNGNRLTLLDFDLARLGTSGPEMEKLSRLKNSSFEEAKELFKGIPGIQMDLNEKLTVVFKK